MRQNFTAHPQGGGGGGGGGCVETRLPVEWSELQPGEELESNFHAGDFDHSMDPGRALAHRGEKLTGRQTTEGQSPAFPSKNEQSLLRGKPGDEEGVIIHKDTHHLCRSNTFLCPMSCRETAEVDCPSAGGRISRFG